MDRWILITSLVWLGATPGASAQAVEELDRPADSPQPVTTDTPVTTDAPVTTDTPQPVAAPPPASTLGGAGESCRARSDCQPNLRCLSNVCRDPLEGVSCGASAECGVHLRCYDHVCRAPGAQFAMPEGRRSRIDGVRPFVGISTLIGPFVSSEFGVAMAAALRFGIYAGIHELAIEVTPFSTLYALEDPVFQANASYAVLLPMTRGSGVALYWPLRLGIGVVANTNDDNVYVEARGDLLGLAFQIDQIMVDFHLPSFRFAWAPDRVTGYSSISRSFIMTWFTGAGVSYMF